MLGVSRSSALLKIMSEVEVSGDVAEEEGRSSEPRAQRFRW